MAPWPLHSILSEANLCPPPQTSSSNSWPPLHHPANLQFQNGGQRGPIFSKKVPVSFAKESTFHKTWSTGKGNGKPLQYSCLENSMNSMKRQKDRTLKDELPRSVGAQYVTGKQWRNNSRNKEEMEPMQYFSLQHWTLLLSSATSTTGHCFHFGSIFSFFLELFLHWFPVAYWTATDLGSTSFSVLSFCLFILFMGLSLQEYWSGLPFPSPVDHILSELSTMTCPSWLALQVL